MATGGNNIKVVLRFRPQNSLEAREGGSLCTVIDEATESVVVNAKDGPSSPFTFDKVFGWEKTQRQIYDYSVRSIVDDVVAGYNGTVFAYGQTGSGKTYTMMGSGVETEEEGKGITPRLVESIFSAILRSPDTIEYTVKVAYMEIYMERIRDLLNPANDNLPIHEDKSRGVYVKGLLEVYVSSVAEVFEVMQRGRQARAVACTNMNSESSRSHSIFVVTITQKNLANGSIKSGRLFLVDLAGSEKVGKTGASGQTLEEAKKINKSLSALGMVINSLTDGKSTHIPYRDSKLTRILQESLGGNSRTTLIINCSPSSWNCDETLSTLRFGMRAKSIKNKAKINQELSGAELRALLRKAKQDVMTFQQYAKALEGEVEVWRSGGTVPKEQQATPKNVLLENVDRSTASLSSSSTARPNSSISGSTTSIDSDAPLATSTVALPEEEREEFLTRENDLADSLAEKEIEIASKDRSLESLQEELKELRNSETTALRETKEMAENVSTMTQQLQRVAFDNQELTITADFLRETNEELTLDVDRLRDEIRALRERHAEVDTTAAKEAMKREKMEKMMADLDPISALSVRENRFKKDVEDPGREEVAEAEAMMMGGADEKIREELKVARIEAKRSEDEVVRLRSVNEDLVKRRDEVEERLTRTDDDFAKMQSEYEDLMDSYIADEDSTAESIQTMKQKLEAQYAHKAELHRKEAEALNVKLSNRDVEINELTNALRESKEKKEGGERGLIDEQSLREKELDLERVRQSMAQQVSKFEVTKRALMRDLQDRCEKVVELEMLLDETRDRHRSAAAVVTRSSSSSAKLGPKNEKMSFLERNLEQLTNVQKQLVEQNASLKKEAAVAERKSKARNDRIESLEGLLKETRERSSTQCKRFEGQLEDLRKRLEVARSVGVERRVGERKREEREEREEMEEVEATTEGGNEERTTRDSSISAASPLVAFGRIAKPLRGGGGGASATESRVADSSNAEGSGDPDVENVATSGEKNSKRTSASSWLTWR